MKTQRRFTKKRAINPKFVLTWERNRVLPKLCQNGFIRKVGTAYRGTSKPSWTTLEIPEIIDRYNYMIRGYLGYYGPVIDYPTDLNYLVYLLRFSCLNTVARKLQTSIKDLIQKFGKQLVFKYKVIKKETTNGETDKAESKEIEARKVLMNWNESKKFIDIRKKAFENRTRRKSKIATADIIQSSVDNIANVKINWRTSFKLSQHCCICGSTDRVEYHHIKHIKKGKVIGLAQVMKQLNRKQIPVCRECHLKIHRGEYDGKKLTDLFDADLAIL